jgi:hypothetical protein
LIFLSILERRSNYVVGVMRRVNLEEKPPTLLPIDECEEWIWDILNSTKDSSFEYIADGDKEFLIFNTNDFHADTRALYKIRRLTGMRLAQMSTHSDILSYGFTDQITSVARTDN